MSYVFTQDVVRFRVESESDFQALKEWSARVGLSWCNKIPAVGIMVEICATKDMKGLNNEWTQAHDKKEQSG